MNTLVQGKDLTKTYGTGQERHKVLHNVNLSVHAGEFVAIVGRSGSGKSTLLHCLSGLLTPDSGEVTIAGKTLPTARNRLARIRRDHVGFVFQELNLISSLTVADNIRLPSRLAGARPSTAEINRILDTIGLKSKARSYPDELSGGQRQRVAVARTLVRKPHVLFADEPTGALDANTSVIVMDLLRQTVTPQSTLVMVTHDLDLAATADRVIVLDQGRLTAELSRPNAEQLFAVLHEG